MNALQQAAEFTPDTRTLSKLIRGGYEFRDERSGFGNTHANAQCIVALTAFRDRFEAPSDAVAVSVAVDGIEDFSIALPESEPTASSDAIGLPLDDRQTEVSVSLGDGTAAYASTIVRYDVDMSKEIERSFGYTIERSYSVYRRNRWRMLEAGDEIRKGDWVRIELGIVSPVVRRFVAITDPTPAGFEPVDASLAAAIPPDQDGSRGWWRAFNERALSNEASKFYAEWLPPGEQTVTYYALAKYAGEFTALPAKVESMYQDGVFATTAPAVLRVTSGAK